MVTFFCALIIPAMITNATAADKLQHVVCFKFKTTATPQDIKQVEQAFQALKQKIPQIVTLEWGTIFQQRATGQRLYALLYCLLQKRKGP